MSFDLKIYKRNDIKSSIQKDDTPQLSNTDDIQYDFMIYNDNQNIYNSISFCMWTEY